MIGAIGYFVSTNDADDKVVAEPDANSNTYVTESTTKSTTTTTTVSPVVQWEQNEEIQILRGYLRIPTFHPDIIYSELFWFFIKQNRNLNKL